MARPKKSLRMARAAKAAMLAAVEVYNKTAFAYREEAFCLLIINAWEILLKARILQTSGEDINAIRQRRDAHRHQRDELTDDVRTIGLPDALPKAGVPNEIRENIRGLYQLRNDVQHFGLVEPAFRGEVLRFGTAAVQNMVRALRDWFDETTEGVYLFPIGFVGDAAAVQATSERQRQMLHRLHELATSGTNERNGYHVAAEITLDIRPSGAAGGTVGITDDPNAPKLQLSDDEWHEMFPATYSDDLIPAVKDRYTDVTINRTFHERMKAVKADSRCTRVRPLNPAKPNGTKQNFFKLDAVFRYHLDQHYKRR